MQPIPGISPSAGSPEEDDTMEGRGEVQLEGSPLVAPPEAAPVHAGYAASSTTSAQPGTSNPDPVRTPTRTLREFCTRSPARGTPSGTTPAEKDVALLSLCPTG
eukprot:6482305-Heterocapsa_arctica.AAC.1